MKAALRYARARSIVSSQKARLAPPPSSVVKGRPNSPSNHLVARKHGGHGQRRGQRRRHVGGVGSRRGLLVRDDWRWWEAVVSKQLVRSIGHVEGGGTARGGGSGGWGLTTHSGRACACPWCWGPWLRVSWSGRAVGAMVRGGQTGRGREALIRLQVGQDPCQIQCHVAALLLNSRQQKQDKNNQSIPMLNISTCIMTSSTLGCQGIR